MSVVEEIRRSVALPQAGTYELDPTHTAVEFVARHMFSKVRGRFTEFEGRIQIAENPVESSVEAVVQTASIQTNEPKRDEHLRSGDFLKADEYPTLTFRSTALRADEGGEFELDGDLTIKDVTKPVTLKGDYLGFTKDPYGNTVVSFSAGATIEREGWGMTWNVALEAGGWLVGKKVDIELEVEARLVTG